MLQAAGSNLQKAWFLFGDVASNLTSTAAVLREMGVNLEMRTLEPPRPSPPEDTLPTTIHDVESPAAPPPLSAPPAAPTPTPSLASRLKSAIVNDLGRFASVVGSTGFALATGSTRYVMNMSREKMHPDQYYARIRRMMMPLSTEAAYKDYARYGRDVVHKFGAMKRSIPGSAVEAWNKLSDSQMLEGTTYDSYITGARETGTAQLPVMGVAGAADYLTGGTRFLFTQLEGAGVSEGVAVIAAAVARDIIVTAALQGATSLAYDYIANHLPQIKAVAETAYTTIANVSWRAGRAMFTPADLMAPQNTTQLPGQLSPAQLEQFKKEQQERDAAEAQRKQKETEQAAAPPAPPAALPPKDPLAPTEVFYPASLEDGITDKDESTQVHQPLTDAHIAQANAFEAEDERDRLAELEQLRIRLDKEADIKRAAIQAEQIALRDQLEKNAQDEIARRQAKEQQQKAEEQRIRDQESFKSPPKKRRAPRAKVAQPAAPVAAPPPATPPPPAAPEPKNVLPPPPVAAPSPTTPAAAGPTTAQSAARLITKALTTVKYDDLSETIKAALSSPEYYPQIRTAKEFEELRLKLNLLASGTKLKDMFKGDDVQFYRKKIAHLYELFIHNKGK